MSLVNWQPHGLIRFFPHECYYQEAYDANIIHGTANSSVRKTTPLMDMILQSTFPLADRIFGIGGREAPVPTSDLECNFIIDYFDVDTESLKKSVFCFAEHKRENPSQPISLKEMEKQAKDCCKPYLNYNTSISFIYAATMAGAHLRLWTCFLEKPEWMPFWGDPEVEDDWGQYKDVGNDADAQEIKQCFEHMKAFPPTSRTGPTYTT